VSDHGSARQVHTDSGVADRGPRRSTPLHRSWRNIGLVAVGGAVGTGLRYLATATVPMWARVPVATIGINIVGAFLLGALLEGLADRGVDTGRSRAVRLAVGTGGLGGFTTYSALSLDTATLFASHPGRAIGYALGTVVIGAVATALGVGLSRRYLRPALAAEPAET
jgi:CrcB protein